MQYQATKKPAFHISGPLSVAQFVRQILRESSDNSREHFIALFLDSGHQVASYSIVSIGTANFTTAHPREVFQRAISAGAVSLVIAHNHPSGQIEPSREDHQTTHRLKAAGELLGITLLDHIIVTDEAHYSFQESGSL